MRSGTFNLVASAAVVAGLVWAMPHAAKAGIMTMTFDTFDDSEQILSGYAGGTGSAGSSGPNFGVTFSPSAAAYAQAGNPSCDAGAGSGNFSGNPSGCNAMGSNGTGSITMTVPQTFGGSLSFYYASGSCFYGALFNNSCADATVDIFDAHGNPLLPDPVALADTTGDGVLDSFTLDTIDFAGVAESVEFDGITVDGFATTYFDNVSIVPEPASLSLLLAALGTFGIIRRRKMA